MTTKRVSIHRTLMAWSKARLPDYVPGTAPYRTIMSGRLEFASNFREAEKRFYGAKPGDVLQKYSGDGVWETLRRWPQHSMDTSAMLEAARLVKY